MLALLAPASEAVMDEAMAGLASRTPTGKRDELWYAFGIRRLLAPYNAVRHQDLEVYTPFLDRRLLEWLRRVPEALRAEKRLVRDALSRRFPDVASIPYATRDNLPAWQRRWREDPILSGFLREWCSAPGWLDTVGIRPAVLDRIERLYVAGPITADPAWRRDLRRLLNRSAPSRILLELGLERRAERNALPEYIQLLRLAVLHGLLGSARRRQSERLVAVQVPMTRSSGSGTTN
jgi:Asparagine synthase